MNEIIDKTKNIQNESRLAIPKRYSFAKLIKKFGFLFSYHLGNKLTLEVVQDGITREIITMREIHKFKNGDYILEIAIQNLHRYYSDNTDTKLPTLHRHYYHINNDGSICIRGLDKFRRFNISKKLLEDNEYTTFFSGVGLNIEPDFICFDETIKIDVRFPIGDIIKNSLEFIKILNFVRLKDSTTSIAPEWADAGYHLTDLDLFDCKNLQLNKHIKDKNLELKVVQISIKSVKITEYTSILCIEVCPYGMPEESMTDYKVITISDDSSEPCGIKLIRYFDSFPFLESINSTLKNLILSSAFTFGL